MRSKNTYKQHRDSWFVHDVSLLWGAAMCFSVLAAGIYELRRFDLYNVEPLTAHQLQQRFNQLTVGQRLCLGEKLQNTDSTVRPVTHFLLDWHLKNCAIEADIQCQPSKRLSL